MTSHGAVVTPARFMQVVSPKTDPFTDPRCQVYPPLQSSRLSYSLLIKTRHTLSICFTGSEKQTGSKTFCFLSCWIPSPSSRVNLFLYSLASSFFLHRLLLSAFNYPQEPNELAEMELTGARTQSNTTAHSQTRALPPKRGLVKIGIFNSIFSSVSALASSAGVGFGGGQHREDADGDREDGDGTPVNSPSMTPQISSGYDSSDAPSDPLLS